MGTRVLRSHFQQTAIKYVPAKHAISTNINIILIIHINMHDIEKNLVYIALFLLIGRIVLYNYEIVIVKY